MLSLNHHAEHAAPRFLSSVLQAVGAVFVLASVVLSVTDVILSMRFKVHSIGAILVTGASSGIGEDAAGTLATVTAFTVFACVRKQANADRLKARYPRIRTVFLDVTSVASIAAAVQHVVDGHPDLPLVGLVNNAGVQSDLPIELQSSEADRFNFDVNVFGLLDVTRAFLPALRATGDGARIVNVGSLAGRVASPGSASYSASKYAVEGLTDSLRREVAPFGISVSLLEPGYVASQMGHKLHATRDKRYGVSADGYDTYRFVFEGFFSEDRRLSRPDAAAPAAATTTPAILHALTSAAPRTRYAVARYGMLPASFVVLVERLLPDRLMDLLV